MLKNRRSFLHKDDILPYPNELGFVLTVFWSPYYPFRSRVYFSLTSNVTMTTLSELNKKTILLFEEAGIPDPEVESVLLLGHLLHKTRTEIYLDGKEIVSPANIEIHNQLISRRLQRVPLSYILGEQEFWSLPFIVSPDVLIPRPETEQLVEIVLKKQRFVEGSKKLVLDLCTGSGVIAAVLALEMPDAKVFAVDRSMDALKIAWRNIMKHCLNNRVSLICGDLGRSVKHGCWDLIVSNPPYVAKDVMGTLSPEVKKEPELALDGGEKGMEVITRLVGELEFLLAPKGWFFMEIGFDQGEQVLELFQDEASFANVKVYEDYAGLARVLQAQKI